MATTADMMDVWYILINHENEPFGEFDSVSVSRDATVVGLKDKIKERNQDIDYRANRKVATRELVVWRCRDRDVGTATSTALINRLKSFVFSEGSDNVVKVAPDNTVEELGLAPNETLLVQVPGAVVWILSKRRGEDHLDESRVLQKAKFCNDSPSSLLGTYPSMQKDPKERIMDDIPKPDADVPPISLLFDGFGQFLDTYRAYDIHPIVTENVSRVFYHSLVDEFAREMCRIWGTERERNDACLVKLNNIFSILGLGNAIFVATYVGVSKMISDGHFLTKHGTAAGVLEIKNNIIQGHIHAEITGYYGHSCRLASEHNKELFRKWRAPCLGIGICDYWITFYAISLLHNKPRVVSLTPWISCVLSASERDQRNALYAAIYAASVLYKRILEDAEWPDRNPHESTMLPYISSLPKEGAASNELLNFTIVELFGRQRESRLLYTAKTADGQELLIKFTQQYSVELHRFCASRGQAPKLLGFKKLPGGWFAIAMEYVSTASHLSDNIHDAGLRDRLISELRALVSSFHNEGLVHGDLRQPNILYNGKTVMLVDFDWGGKDGEVSYPTVQLCDELLIGRQASDWKIRRTDDVRVMENTVADILRGSST